MENDVINHPSHYTYSKVEPIEAITAWGLDFCLGNTIKYIARAGHKDDRLQDLKKAQFYLNRAVKDLEAK